eukprot:Hpha_TRINITY_DN34664_c0_g1::TRINITY_DN34664_c0_g1_i1::g.21057::m.21057
MLRGRSREARRFLFGASRGSRFGVTRGMQMRECGHSAQDGTSAAKSYKQHNTPQPEQPGEELFRLGRLFCVRELPEKMSKGKQYSAFEVTPGLSPHLLDSAAPLLHQRGAFPGLFSRGVDGKPRNVRFAEAQKDVEALRHIWLLVFIPTDLSQAWRDGLLKEVLMEAAKQHAASYGGEQAKQFGVVKHWGNRDDVEFEGGRIGKGICYSISGPNADILLTVSAALGEQGYTYSGLVTSNPDGSAKAPELMVTIPATELGLIESFTEVADQAVQSSVGRYRKSVLDELTQLNKEKTGSLLEKAEEEAE